LLKLLEAPDDAVQAVPLFVQRPDDLVEVHGAQVPLSRM
jgi:hypothetical protein